MSKIITFPGAQERLQQINLENSLTGLDYLVEQGLNQTPKRVNDLLSTPLNQIVTLSPDEMRDIAFEYFLHKLDLKRAKLSLDVIKATQYLADLLLRLGVVMDQETKEILENPYYTYWIERDMPKRAGDSSVFNLIFPKTKGDFLRADEYIKFALNGYSFHFGKDFAGGMSKVLPLAENFTKENPFFKRSFQAIK